VGHSLYPYLASPSWNMICSTLCCHAPPSFNLSKIGGVHFGPTRGILLSTNNYRKYIFRFNINVLNNWYNLKILIQCLNFWFWNFQHIKNKFNNVNVFKNFLLCFWLDWWKGFNISLNWSQVQIWPPWLKIWDFQHLIFYFFEIFSKSENNIICAKPEKVLRYTKNTRMW
jgi:hypothetical protein